MGRGMRHSSSVATQKSAGTSPGTIYRLSDMDVEEVSLVDRAANKKKFLVVKRDGDQMTTQVHPDGKGGFTTTTGAGGAGGTAPTSTTKAGLEVPPGFKQVAGPMLTKVSERLAALSEAVDGAAEAEVGDDGTLPGVPGEFVTELGTIMGLLEKLGSMFPEAAPEMDAAEDAAEAGAAEQEPTEAAELQMRLASEHLTKLVAKRQMSKALVAKIGAKMSKDRLTRLQQAVSVLSNLVNEVAGAPATPPAGAPPVGKDATKKADPLAAMQAQLTELVGVVGGLAGVVKQTQAGLQQVQKSRGAPASGPVETTHVAKGADGDVSWPMDMNNPITRDTVGKGESFFDD